MDVLNNEIVRVLEMAKDSINTLMGCNEISKVADIDGEKTIDEINKLLVKIR